VHLSTQSQFVCRTIDGLNACVADQAVGSGADAHSASLCRAGESPLQQRLGHLEPDEIVILLRRVAILGHLHRVEPEFRLQMRGVVLRVPNGIAEFGPQLRILDGNGLVDGRMAGDVRGIVRKRDQREKRIRWHPDSALAALERNHHCERSAPNC